MLASPMIKHSDISVEAWNSEKWIAEEKIHGYRATLGFNGTGAWAYSRFLSDVDFLPVQHPVAGFLSDAAKLDPRWVLDVEITADADKLRDLLDSSGFPVSPAYEPLDVFMSLSYQDQKNLLASLGANQIIFRYFVLDVLESPQNKEAFNLPLHARRVLRSDLMSECLHAGVYHIDRPVSVIGTRQDKLAFFQEIKEKGGDGIILKNLDGVWEASKRSPDWQKVKVLKYLHDTDTIDAFISNWEDDNTAELSVYQFAKEEPTVIAVLQIPGGKEVAKIAKSVEIARDENGAWEFIRLRPYRQPDRCTYSILDEGTQ